MNKWITGSIVSIGLAAAAPLTVAQTTDQVAQAPQHRHAQRHHQGERAFSLPSERVEARLAYFRTALKITDAQQTQWDAFANVLRKHAKEADTRMEKRRAARAQGAERSRLNAIARMELRQQRMATASARLGEVLEAGKPLYAALSPEQQQVADQLLAPRSQGKFRHGNRMRGQG